MRHSCSYFLIYLGMIGCVVLLLMIGINRRSVDSIEIRSRINPNTASSVSMERLEGIGPARAESIIEYRQTRSMPAFARPGDLQRIHGIGPKTVEKIKDELYFDQE